MIPTPATGATRRPRLAAAAAVAGALLLTGCGAGQVASTTSQVAAVNGGAATSKQVELRNVVMTTPPGDATWPAGSDVPLTFTLVNSSGTPDTLVRVSTPAASSVDVTGTTTVPGHSSLSGVADGSAAAQQGATQSTENQSSETPALYAGTLQVTLRGLTSPITSGLTAPVTFTFSGAGDVLVPVPVAYNDAPRSTSTG